MDNTKHDGKRIRNFEVVITTHPYAMLGGTEYNHDPYPSSQRSRSPIRVSNLKCLEIALELC